MHPSRSFISRPTEGVGNAGCPLHPQPRVHSVESTRVFTTGPPGSPGIPARNGFNGFLRALPGDRYQIHTFGSLRVVPYLMRRKASRPIRITFGPGFP